MRDQEEGVVELFDRALGADEFEYCCTLLRVNGMQMSSSDPLHESDAVMQQIAGLAAAQAQAELKLRLYLFLYCHVTEMDDMYSVPMNLLRVVEGDRYSIAPFAAAGGPTSPGEKAAVVAALARRLGFAALAELYEMMLVKNVRNAFFHSDYSILGGDFVIYRGRGPEIDGVRTKVVPFDWLVPRMEAGINLALQLVHELTSRREAYRTEKTIATPRAVAGGITEATLVVDERGLVGFRA